VKSKFALMLLAGVSSGVLVVSALAQQPSRDLNVEPASPIVGRPGELPQYTSDSISSIYGLNGAQSTEEASFARRASIVAHQLGSAKSDADREKLKAQLSTILEKQFELRQQRHKKEIESLEAQVKKLRDLVDKRQENRREIVAKRLDQILQEAQGLGW